MGNVYTMVSHWFSFCWITLSAVDFKRVLDTKVSRPQPNRFIFMEVLVEHRVFK